MATPKKQPAAKSIPVGEPKPHPVARKMATLRLPRHGALIIAAIAGIVVFTLMLWLNPSSALIGGSIAMFIVYLVLIGLTMPILTGDYLRSRADDADAPTAIIFAVVLAVVGLCCATLFKTLHAQGGPAAEEVALSVVSVLLGWFVVHTMAAMHYAYEYYETASDAAGAGHVGGLDFRQSEAPDGMAFLYFSYVIGVAFAVSDIQIASPKMRRIVLIHSVFSYFFNTLIVAATVNVAVAVGGS